MAVNLWHGSKRLVEKGFALAMPGSMQERSLFVRQKKKGKRMVLYARVPYPGRVTAFSRLLWGYRRMSPGRN